MFSFCALRKNWRTSYPNVFSFICWSILWWLQTVVIKLWGLGNLQVVIGEKLASLLGNIVFALVPLILLLLTVEFAMLILMLVMVVMMMMLSEAAIFSLSQNRFYRLVRWRCQTYPRTRLDFVVYGCGSHWNWVERRIAIAYLVGLLDWSQSLVVKRSLRIFPASTKDVYFFLFFNLVHIFDFFIHS